MSRALPVRLSATDSLRTAVALGGSVFRLGWFLPPLAGVLFVLPLATAWADESIGVAIEAGSDETSRAIEAGIVKAMQTPVDVDFNETPLADAFRTLGNKYGVPFDIDETAISDEGIRTDTPITLKLSGVTLGSVLKLMLTSLQMTTLRENGVVRVTTTVKAGERLQTRTYDLNGLLRVDDDHNAIVRVLNEVIEPDSWSDTGGPGTMTKIRNGLGIRQTEAVHARIDALLGDLERVLSVATGQPQPPPATNPVHDHDAIIYRKLAGRASLKCEEQPLKDVLAALSRFHGVPIWLDETAISDEGIQTDTPITFNHENLRLEQILNLIFDSMQLTWVVEDEVLKITSSVRASEALITRTFDVRDLITAAELPVPASNSYFEDASVSDTTSGWSGIPVKRGVSHVHWIREPSTADRQCTALKILLMETVQPDTWADTGGPGSIDHVAGVLIVRQTQSVHREIEQLLPRLRQVSRPAEPADQAAKAAPRLDLVVYRIGGDRARELAPVIEAVIAPESWNRDRGMMMPPGAGLNNRGGKGTIHGVEGALIVRQTRDVHQQIWTLINAMPGMRLDPSDMPAMTNDAAAAAQPGNAGGKGPPACCCCPAKPQQNKPPPADNAKPPEPKTD